jgi:hypothetical protein
LFGLGFARVIYRNGPESDSDHGSAALGNPGQTLTALNDDAELRALHRRVLAGDVNAMSALFDAVFDCVSQSLRRSFPGAPRDWVSDAVVVALLQFARTPIRDVDRFHTVRQILLMSASRNVEASADFRRSAKNA